MASRPGPVLTSVEERNRGYADLRQPHDEQDDVQRVDRRPALREPRDTGRLDNLVDLDAGRPPGTRERLLELLLRSFAAEVYPRAVIEFDALIGKLERGEPVAIMNDT